MYRKYLDYLTLLHKEKIAMNKMFCSVCSVSSGISSYVIFSHDQVQIALENSLKEDEKSLGKPCIFKVTKVYEP